MRFAQQGLALIESWSFRRTKLVGVWLVLSHVKTAQRFTKLCHSWLLFLRCFENYQYSYLKLTYKVSISKFKAYGKSLITYLFPPRKLKSSHTPFSKVFQSQSTFTTDSHNTLKIYTAIDSQTAEVSKKRVHFTERSLEKYYTTRLSLLGRYRLHKNTDTFLIS